MKVIRVDYNIDRELILKKIGSTDAGNKILIDKMRLNFLYIKDIKSPAANILKQDALSIGADLAVEKSTILCKNITTDALLIANDKQLKLLSKKELLQPFGLKEFAKELLKYIDQKSFNKEMMAILNINRDSFYKGSRFLGKDAVLKIEGLIGDGADIIDIGALSSRPGSDKISPEDELDRVKPVIDSIYKNRLYEDVVFSIDSYEPLVVQYALDHGFKIVNDITGLRDDKVAELASKYRARVVIMHMRGTPKDMQNNLIYEDIVLEVEEFFKKRVKKALDFGIDDIILDVGIGFAKSLEHNLKLIKALSNFKKFNFPLLIGASRKSLIDKIVPSDVEDRLAGTLALHIKAYEEGASIFRCHDLKEHIMAFKVIDALDRSLV